jgi:hypothetical protein
MASADGAKAKAQDYTNLGIFALRSPRYAPDAPTTVIVSGVGRSGTSMTAAVIRALGVPMGKTHSPLVEDEDFQHALLYFNYNLLDQLIETRNQESPRWGFKFASLQNHLLPPQFAKFRNPLLIVVMRDPVAVACRATLSDPEIAGGAEAFFNVAKQTQDMMAFVAKAPCPALLVSYEKFLSFPDHAIDTIAAFCGIEVTKATRAKARQAITPNNQAYIKQFHQDFKGHFDAIQKSVARGWCSSVHHNNPVTVELVAENAVLASAVADIYRHDLEAAGIGTGRHSFEIDLSDLDVPEEAILRLRVAGTECVIDGSYRTFKNMLSD